MFCARKAALFACKTRCRADALCQNQLKEGRRFRFFFRKANYFNALARIFLPAWPNRPRGSPRRNPRKAPLGVSEGFGFDAICYQAYRYFQKMEYLFYLSHFMEPGRRRIPHQPKALWPAMECPR
jgi:hypothetical protein